MSLINTYSFRSPYGELLLGEYENELCLCDWKYRKMRSAIDKRLQSGLNTSYLHVEKNDFLRHAQNELEEYFAGDRQDFDLPLRFCGTDFQIQVWEKVHLIPFGSVMTYGDIAAQTKNKGSARAVGTANGANALALFIPCHRVIGKSGEPVGYAGGIRVKEKLNAFEQQFKKPR